MTITRGRVPYDDLRGYLQLLEERGMLKRISRDAKVSSVGDMDSILSLRRN